MKFHKNSALSIFSLVLVFNTHPLHAHNEALLDAKVAPSCVSVADDPDGDGNGWSPHLFGGHTCIVTKETTLHPHSVDLGGQMLNISMIQNHWDPNVDFVNREIECTNYLWNSDSEKPEVEDVFTITHYPLSGSEPSLGEFEIRVTTDATETLVGMAVWQSTNGRYSSDSFFVGPDKAFKMYADPWGEKIEFGDQQGMRFWYNHLQLQKEQVVVDGSKVQECRYTSAEDFLPSGHLDEAPTELNVVTVQVSQAAVEVTPVKPEIINPQTGELVELKALSWDLQEDLFQKKIWCSDYYWNTESFESTYPEADGYLFMPPSEGETRGNVYVDARGQGITTQYEWSIVDGNLTTTSLFPTEGWYETVSSGKDDIRIWAQNSYDACSLDRERTVQKLEPSGEVSEKASAVVTPRPITEPAGEIAQVASTGGGGISLFLLVLLSCRLRNKQR